MTEKERQKMTLLLARFVEAMTAWGWSNRTIPGYEQNVRVFFDWLDEETDIVHLGEVTAETLASYQTMLLSATKPNGEGLSLSTQRQRLTVIKRFFLFLAQEGKLLSNPAHSLSLPKRRRNLPQANLTPREAVRLLEAIDTTSVIGTRDRAMVELLYSTGIRNAELRALELGDFDADAGTLLIRCGKGRKDRVVPIGHAASEAIERYLEQARPRLAAWNPGVTFLFLTMRGRKLDGLAVINAVKRAAKAAGLKKEIRPHRLRHACGTHMLKKGADIRHIQRLLGHASLETTQLYTKVEISDLQAVHRRFHPREKKK